MKIRLAKKIMKQQVENCLPKNKVSRYWFTRWFSFELYCCFMHGKADHRITKATSLTSKISTIVDTSKRKKHGNSK